MEVWYLYSSNLEHLFITEKQSSCSTVVWTSQLSTWCTPSCPCSTRPPDTCRWLYWSLISLFINLEHLFITEKQSSCASVVWTSQPPTWCTPPCPCSTCPPATWRWLYGSLRVLPVCPINFLFSVLPLKMPHSMSNRPWIENYMRSA
jgi:hypothetical protein